MNLSIHTSLLILCQVASLLTNELETTYGNIHVFVKTNGCHDDCLCNKAMHSIPYEFSQDSLRGR